MKRAYILTRWVGIGSEIDPYRFELREHHFAHGMKLEDVTGQLAGRLPPNPNALIVRVTCPDALMAAIQADSRYSGCILWLEELRGLTPDAAEFGLLRAALARLGVSQADINAVIGNNPAGRTRGEIAEALLAWLKDLPQG